MQYCDNCGSEIPVRSHFCGTCGHLLGDETKGASEVTRLSQPDLPALGTPSLLKNPFHPPIDYAQLEQSDAGATIQHDWSELDEGNQQAQQLQQPGERHTDENRAFFPDAILPFTPLGYGQFPAANAPAVQGTPQIGGVPSVPGTPSAGMSPASPGAPPVQGGAAPHAAPSIPHVAQSAPQHDWTWEQPQHPVEHAQPTPHHQPQHPTQASPQHYHQLHATVQPTHIAKAGVTTTKVAAGVATKWGIVVLTAVVVLAASGVLYVFANAPGLSLSGGSTVSVGGSLHIHGKGFVPGGSVAFTLDNGLPVTAIGTQAKSIASVGAGSGAADASQLLTTTGETEKLATSNNTVTVSITGNFDADVAASPTWSPGQHTIHATEGLGSRSATLVFTVLAVSAHLTVSPATLDFSTIPMGSKVVKSVLIGNTGGSQLTWKATTDGSSWLKLTNSIGAVEPNSAQEPFYVTVDASNLKIGAYSASFHVHSTNGGDAQIPVQVHIGPASKIKQAQLSVNPSTLDFGKLPPGQQVFNNITVANQGTLALKWQADAGGASWLTLSPTSGNVAVGGLPSTVQVVADSSSRSLHSGLNTATITIKSNGGMTTIAVTLTLNSSPPPPGSPTPTVTPTVPPPILSSSPSGFSLPGDPNCTYNAALGWSCTATLSSFANAQSNLSWSATSSGINGVSFSPSSGTLTPGQTARVTISIPNSVCPANATFTFQGPANSVPMAWSCAAPTLNVNPASVNANTGCTFGSGWSCTVTLSASPGDQGILNWKASSSGISGITFNPPSGTLTAGQPAMVKVVVPNTACPASATFTFNGVNVAWSCGTAMLKVSPTAYNIPDKNCSYVAGQGWSCTATLSLSSSGDPATTWSASAQGGCCSVQFNPPSGTLLPGQPTTVTITIADTTCPANLNLLFLLSGSNTVTVPWTCNPPSLSVGPPGVNNCPYNSGSYTCNVTVSIPSSSQGSVSWSASASNNLPGVTFNPPSGTLSTANSQTPVTVTVPGSDCQDGSFMFSEKGGNQANVSWTCKTTAILSADNTTFNSSNCTNSGKVWTCTVKLSSNTSLNWYANSSDPSAIGFNPSGGPVSPGSPVQVTITIPYSCPSTATLDFIGPNNTVHATWSC